MLLTLNYFLNNDECWVSELVIIKNLVEIPEIEVYLAIKDKF